MYDTNDFLLERRLQNEAPDLNLRVKNCVYFTKDILDTFIGWFPNFTDHSLLHSLDVLYFSNCLLGEKAYALSIPECYCLVMSCYLHDIGMCVNRTGFEKFTAQIRFEDYHKNHPDASEARIIRDFHHEYSALFIREYAVFFEIPSEELLFSIIQVSRGHRKTDLYDETEYPDIKTEDGIIRTAFLSAILRLADEIDVAADRNPEILFDTSTLTEQIDIDMFGIHDSILAVDVLPEKIVLKVKPKEPRFAPLVEDLAVKIQKTLDYCRNVAQKRSDLPITQEKAVIEWL